MRLIEKYGIKHDEWKAVAVVGEVLPLTKHSKAHVYIPTQAGRLLIEAALLLIALTVWGH